MQIILNGELVAKENPFYPKNISYFIKRTASTRCPIEKDEKYKIINRGNDVNLYNSGFVGLLSAAYSKHLPVAIAPHDLWIVIMSELTNEVAAHPEEYRSLFTPSQEKEKISVYSDSLTEMPIGVLSAAVQNKVLFDSKILFQNFSTETPIVSETIQSIFCDMASPFYDYGMFCCGIPSIEILGLTEDWEKVLGGFKDIEQTFKTERVTQYFNKVVLILEQFVKASQGDVDLNFWKNIFTQQNVGSGGDLTIDGWITKFFIKEHDFAKINHFTSNIGVVKYKQQQTDEEFVAIYGGFDTKQNEHGFYELQYSKFILQKVKL